MNNFKTLKNHVYDYIAEQISLGEIALGEKINENKICESLSVSRTPVREALIELSCFGVLENVPRRGFIVKNLSLKDIADIYAVIGVLEGEAGYLACDALNKRELSDMKFYVDSMYLAIEQGNFSMYHRQQMEFHKIFVNKCGNDELVNTLDNLKSKLIKRDFDENKHPNIKEVLRQTNAEHEKIYDLFLKKDAAAVSSYLKEVHWCSHHAGFEVL